MGRIAYAKLRAENANAVTYEIRRYPEDEPHTEVTLSGPNWEHWSEPTSMESALSADASSIAWKALKYYRANGAWPQKFGYYS